MSLLPRNKRDLSTAYFKVLRTACYFFLALGVTALGYVGYVSADSKAFHAVEKGKFAQAIVPQILRVPRDGDVIGEIQVPRLGLDAMVIQGESARNLQRAVGHLSNSAMPGEWGNVALAGHRDTFFRPLRNIRTGDEIRFKTAGGPLSIEWRRLKSSGPGTPKYCNPPRAAT